MKKINEYGEEVITSGRFMNKDLSDELLKLEREELAELSQQMAKSLQNKRTSQYLGRTIEDVLRAHESMGCDGFYVTRVDGEIQVMGECETPKYLRQA